MSNILRLFLAILVLAGAAGACTIAAFGPTTTVDGRPILWKNRDVSNEEQELRYFEDGRYRYVANVYAGESLRVWAGINERGFAIMNSDAHNIGGRDGDDGHVMKLALQTCATVEEFKLLMDSLDEVGRDKAGNFGVFDSTGMTSIFEAANTFYYRFDAADESLGLLIRANYAYAGDSNRLSGRNRHDRAWQLVLERLGHGRIDVEFIIQTLSRDIGQVGFDPYPLPWLDTLGDLPFGFLPTDTTLGRTLTRSVEIMVGPRPGEPASSGMMWILLGSPFATTPIPAWVQGGPVPEPMNGPDRSRICDEAILVDKYIRSAPGLPYAVNTFALRAVTDFFAPAESLVLDEVKRLMAESGESGPTAEEARALTHKAAWDVLDGYARFWHQFEWATTVGLPEDEPTGVATLVGDRLLVRLWPGRVRVRVFDVQGRVAIDQTVTDSSELELDVSGLPAGGYFVVCGDDRTTGSAPVRSRFIRLP